MSCGTPVIVSDVGALPDFIESNKNGFVFHDRDLNDLNKKISRIIEDKILAISMGKYCRNIVEKRYDWKVIAKKVRKIYASCLKTKS